MNDGYSKSVFDRKNIILNNVAALYEVITKYNFRNDAPLTFSLEHISDKIKICYKDPEKIMIYVSFKQKIDPEKKDELSSKLMVLNDKYQLNLGIKENVVTCNHTVFCRPFAVSTEAFTDTFEKHMNRIYEHENEIIRTINKYALSFLELDVLLMNFDNDFANSLEQRPRRRFPHISLRERRLPDDFFTMDLDPGNFDDEDEED